ncbi:nucleoside hydrolase, partial [Nocardia sp. NPDC005366]|uniref:nucleoside hydrolase n=1 Tax=Nocardia sp. NPDC005366 TaxID=3156878 RepID=UPI0033B4B0A2
GQPTFRESSDQPKTMQQEPIQQQVRTGDRNIGGDPDDFVALVIAARLVPQLLVVTADEVGGLRAELARRVLELLGRGDVEVIEGIDLGGRRLFLPDPGQSVPPYVLASVEEREDRRHELADALNQRIVNSDGPVRWVGCGPMTNLATLLRAAPEIAEQITVTQMGGWVDHYRDPERAEHNLRTDSLATGWALRILPAPRLVLADHTNHPAIQVTADWALMQAWESDAAPGWARLLSAHFHRWIARGYEGSWMHDPLTLSAALGLPFVSFAEERLRIGDDARLYRDPYGRVMQVSVAADYAGFLRWLHQVLSW